jgi:hypothetical protein
MSGWDGLGSWTSDPRPWSDVSVERNQEGVRDYQPNSAWSGPVKGDTDWQAPGHNRMFHDDGDIPDNPHRAFTTRKKHGWWGKEERYDMRGRLID